MPRGIRPTTADIGHILALGVRFYLPQTGHSVVHLGYLSSEYRAKLALSTKLCWFELLFSEKPCLARIPAFQINKKPALS